MNMEIRYYTKTGNTKKLADAIANEINVEAKTTDIPIEHDTDILFLGSSVYAAGVDPEVKNFIQSLNGKVKQVVAFSTAALLPSTFSQIKKLLIEQGIPVNDKEFHCRGQFKIMHRGKPNANDLESAREFARQFL